MPDFSIPTEPKTALNIVCLYLAQNGKPHSDLGYVTQDAAFEDIGSVFGLAKKSVKLERDRYDRFTNSDKVGWKEAALPKRLQSVFDDFATCDRGELLELSKKILAKDWPANQKDRSDGSALFDRVVAELNAPTQVRNPMGGIYVEFSNSGIKSDGWFILTVEQILGILEDLIKNQAAIVAEEGLESVYVEARWRILFKKYLSNDVSKTMGSVQTMPLFELLSKIVHFANSDTNRKVKALNLDLDGLKVAKKELEGWWRNTQKQAATKVASSALEGGENVIFYGAPGTGKSNRVEKIVNDAGKEPIRTVFHPDLQNSDFFGCLKPRMSGDNVRYEFAPGPFMEALAEAYEKPDEPVYLVIEELNRAAAAAVFGDLFLLLDRKENGAGEYSVSFPSPESRVWLEGMAGAALERIELPSNLFIYATMNSADQGVYPIDTAFRRRWRQEYLPLDYTKGPVGEIAYVDVDDKRHTLEWRGFVEVLNNYLVSNHTLAITEDRLLGQWFVKEKELDGAGIPEKVLLYLWDDLLRHEGRYHIFDTDMINTYGALDKAAKDRTQFLSADFLGVLKEIPKAEPESVDADNVG